MLSEILKKYDNLYLKENKRIYYLSHFTGFMLSLTSLFGIFVGYFLIELLLAEFSKSLTNNKMKFEIGNVIRAMDTWPMRTLIVLFGFTLIVYILGEMIISLKKYKLNNSLIFIFQSYLPGEFIENVNLSTLKGIEAERVKLYETICFLMDVFKNNIICLDPNYLHIIIEEMSRKVDSDAGKLEDDSVSKFARIVKDWIIPTLGVMVGIMALLRDVKAWKTFILAIMLILFALLFYLIEKVPQKIIYEAYNDEIKEKENLMLLRSEFMLLEEQINSGFNILPKSYAKKVAMKIAGKRVNLEEIEPCFLKEHGKNKTWTTASVSGNYVIFVKHTIASKNGSYYDKTTTYRYVVK